MNEISNQKKKILILTSFNEKCLKEYAKDFLNTYNLPFDLVIYSEDELDLSEFKIKNLKLENLYDDKEFENFIKSDPPEEFTSRRSSKKCNKNCPDYCFEHQFNIDKKVSKNKRCKKAVNQLKKNGIEIPTCFNSRVSAIDGLCLNCLGPENHSKECKKFSFKVFSQKNAISKYKNDYEYLLWIDADCIFNDVPTDEFYNLVKTTIEDKMIGFMRRPTYSECGFLIYNLNHQYLTEYYDSVSNIYLSNEIYYTQQNHDSFIMDLIRERIEKKYKTKIHVDIALPGKNNGIKCDKKGNILELTKFVRYFYHHKGDKKFLSLEEKKLK